jgi:hypothetical protein
MSLYFIQKTGISHGLGALLFGCIGIDAHAGDGISARLRCAAYMYKRSFQALGGQRGSKGSFVDSQLVVD